MTRTCAAALACVFAATAVAHAEAPSEGRTLVMPFENTGKDSRPFWLGEAASVLLTDDLDARGERVFSRQERQQGFERLQVPPSSTLTDATIIRIAELLGAARVIVGSFQVEGDTISVHARRIALEAGRVEADVTDRGSLVELYGVFERTAASLSPGTLGSPGSTSSSAPPKNPSMSAFEAYIKGLVAVKTEAAVNFLNAALRLEPTYDRARLALWDVYTEAGEHQRALEAVRGVPAASRWARRAVFAAGLSQVSLKRYDEAFDSFKRLADQQPTPTVLNNLGAVILKRGATPQTGLPESYFNRAVELDPEEADYSFNLGYAYGQKKDVQTAIHWLREAVRRNPADGDAHFVLGTSLLATGSTAEGSRERDLARRLSSTYEQWLKRPAGEEVPKGLERLKTDLDLLHAKRIDAALTTTAERDQKELAQFYFDRGRRSYQQGNDADAAADLGRALYLSPYLAEAHLLIGRIHLRHGRLREAVDALKLSLWSGESAAAHAALADAYRQQQDSAGARAEAERALALDPSSEEARRVLGMVQSR